MRVVRKVAMPAFWFVVFTTISVSLAVMAFGSDDDGSGSGPRPSGELVVSEAMVERSTIENTLDLKGAIAVDAPVATKASHEGVVNHLFVPSGAKVSAGDPIFQIRSEDVPAASTGDEESTSQARPAVSFHTVVAPAAGTVGEFTVAVDDTIGKGDTVTSIRQNSFRASASIDPADLYRLLDMPKSATISITGGPAPFECDELSIGDVTSSGTGATSGGAEQDGMEQELSGDPEGQGSEGGTTIGCRVPDDVRVFDGLPMNMSIDAGRAEDVLVVPVTAVRGLVESGTVWVIGDDGEATEREVRLGLTDGMFVEVTKGVDEGDSILEFVPGAEDEGFGEVDGYVMGMAG